jgi:hypothetical protein
MNGQAHIRTIDFLGENNDPALTPLLRTFNPGRKSSVPRDDTLVLKYDA